MARDARTSAGGAAGTAADGADLHRPGRRTKDARSTRPPTTWTRRPRSLLPWTGGPRLPGLASGRSLRVILGGRSWAWDESRELALAFSGIGGLSVPGGLLSCRLRIEWLVPPTATYLRTLANRPARQEPGYAFASMASSPTRQAQKTTWLAPERSPATAWSHDRALSQAPGRPLSPPERAAIAGCLPHPNGHARGGMSGGPQRRATVLPG